VHSFLMLVFNALLLLIGNDKIAGLDYLKCARLSNVPEINWYQAIVDDFNVKARYLNNKISNNDGSIPNVQGCIAFLIVSFCQLFLVFLCLPFITIFNFRSAISCLGQPFHVYVSDFIFYKPFHVVSAISYCVNQFTYLVSHSMFRAAILYGVCHFPIVSPISCLLAISMVCPYFILCQPFYFSIRFFISIVSHFLVTCFFGCVLQVYYPNNLLNNVPVPAGTPRCQFFTSDVIDRISNLDRVVSRDGLMTFGKLPVSKTCFVSSFSHYCHLIVKTV
jgi:hypothetical protein